MNKLSKNKSAPFPLFFPNVESMEVISNKEPVLRDIFKMLNTGSTNRIDGM